MSFLLKKINKRNITSVSSVALYVHNNVCVFMRMCVHTRISDNLCGLMSVYNRLNHSLSFSMRIRSFILVAIENLTYQLVSEMCCP